MRKFYLRNEGGTVERQYQLQYTDAFLWQPGGLGFSYDRSYAESDGFYLKLNEVLSQTPKTGTIVFLGSNPYADYKAFVDWVTASQKLKLAYSTDDVTYYFMDVDVENLEKSEIQLDGTLQCSITMLPTSPIYLIDSTKVEINGELPSNMKRYDYTYALDPDAVAPYTEKDYWYTYSDTAVAGTITITPQAQLPCCFEIYTNKAVSQPVLTFTDEHGNIFGRVDLSAISFTPQDAPNDYLLYSNIPTSAGVTQRVSGTVSDITNYLGISPQYPSFFTLPAKRTTSVTLSADSLVGVEIEIRVYRYFVSV